MASIIKVDTIQDQDGNNIINENANTITIGKSGDTVQVASGAEFVGGGIQWQSDIKTSAFTAVAGEGYWINTTSAAVTVTLPASASVGDTIEISDYARTWGTNNLTINQNSLNFQGRTTPNPIYETNGQSVRIVYSGATQGWIPTTDDDVRDASDPSYSASFLIIAGGGGGAGGDGGNGGGGAGGYRLSFGSDVSGGGTASETPLSLTPGTVYTVTVGGGGAGHPSSPAGGGTAGVDSSISGSDITTVTSNGGGAGGYSNNNKDGGSGGGSTTANVSGGSGTAGQGFNGGIGAPSYAGGGGGGAGAIGGTGTSPGSGGAGGAGVATSITGSSVTRAGGGGAGGDNRYTGVTGGAGGAGGGGAGASLGSSTAGTVNTGSGGGAGGTAPAAFIAGSAGGSGVVILRVPTANYSGTTTGSPTVSTFGTDTIMVFNSSGSYTG